MHTTAAAAVVERPWLCMHFWQYMGFHLQHSFHHASRHKTTWTGWLKDQNAPSGSSKIVAIYTQIEFVLCKQNVKLMLQDAYGGATLSSDHKPVVARLRFDGRCLMYKQPKKWHPQVRFETSRLVSDEDTCHAYLLSLNERINSMPNSLYLKVRLEWVLKCVKDAATDNVGRPIGSQTISPATCPETSY